MAIRDHFRRSKRSDSSSTVSQTTTNTTITTTTTSDSSGDESTPPLRKQPSRLARTFTFGSSKSDEEKQREKQEKKEKKEAKKKAHSVIHPSERPLTLQNLRHQQMLGQFSFDSDNGEQSPTRVERQRFSYIHGVSPCCSRRPSFVDDEEDGGPLCLAPSRGARSAVEVLDGETVQE